MALTSALLTRGSIWLTDGKELGKTDSLDLILEVSKGDGSVKYTNLEEAKNFELHIDTYLRICEPFWLQPGDTVVGPVEDTPLKKTKYLVVGIRYAEGQNTYLAVFSDGSSIDIAALHGAEVV